jgi:hypothetical protein
VPLQWLAVSYVSNWFDRGVPSQLDKFEETNEDTLCAAYELARWHPRAAISAHGKVRIAIANRAVSRSIDRLACS